MPFCLQTGRKFPMNRRLTGNPVSLAPFRSAFMSPLQSKWLHKLNKLKQNKRSSIFAIAKLLWGKQEVMHLDWNFYSSFPIYWPLKGLYNTCHIHAFTHNFTHWWQQLPCKVPTCPSGVIRSLVSWSSILWHESVAQHSLVIVELRESSYIKQAPTQGSPPFCQLWHRVLHPSGCSGVDTGAREWESLVTRQTTLQSATMPVSKDQSTPPCYPQKLQTPLHSQKQISI